MRMRRNWKGQANPRTVLLAGPFKAPKSRNRLGKPPVMTEREAEGVALLTRVWGRLQQQGQARDKARTHKTKAKYHPGDVLWDTMVLVSKVRGRLRRGKYREA